jgi:hypothetical protein
MAADNQSMKPCRESRGKRVVVGSRATCRAIAGFAIGIVIVAGCGGNAETVATPVDSVSATTTTIAGPSPQEVNDLRATAIASAEAWLTGTLHDIVAARHGGCGSPEVPAPDVDDPSWAPMIRTMRANFEHQMGVSFASITIRGVLLRSLTATSGEADVQYDLPDSVAGNDNWIRYKFNGVEWTPIDCFPPIGGTVKSRHLYATSPHSGTAFSLNDLSVPASSTSTPTP